MRNIVYGGEDKFNSLVIPFTVYLGQSIPAGYEHLPVVSTIRNPFTYFVSYWLFIKPQRPENVELAPYSSFEEWVRACPGYYQEKYKLFIPNDPNKVKMIRLENQKEDFIRVMGEVGIVLSPEQKELIRAEPRHQVNLERTKPYREYYDDNLIKLVLEHNSLIFDSYYPDRTFPEED